MKKLAITLAVALAVVSTAALAATSYLVKGKYVSGNLVFTKASDNSVLLTISPTAVNVGTGIALQLDGTAVTATATELNQYTVTAFMADAGTAGSTYVVCPFAGDIKKLSVVNWVANATTGTVYLAKIGGTNVTAPSWTHGTTDAAGTGVTVVPTAANTVTAGQVLELASDGGSSSVMPVMFSVTIER